MLLRWRKPAAEKIAAQLTSLADAPARADNLGPLPVPHNHCWSRAVAVHPIELTRFTVVAYVPTGIRRSVIGSSVLAA